MNPLRQFWDARPAERARLVKPALYAAALLPLVNLAQGWFRGSFETSAFVVEEVILRSGNWAIRFLLASLAVTPLRGITGWNWLATYRRPLGLLSFTYATLHLLVYVVLDFGLAFDLLILDVVGAGYIIVGQDEAIAAVADAIRRNKSGLADPEQPLGAFIFLGPTGVGKTELAKALAAWLFDDERALTRIDMSEYLEKHAVSRLIGAPPGYVGYEEGGQLTEAVRRRPYSVILFDEMEKAHPDVFNTLLQLLDDGRLTDGQGRVVDFRNTIVIMTGNVGSDLIQNAPDLEEVREPIGALMRATFRPEFLNRIDETILFHRLDRQHIERIVRIQLDRIAERLQGRRIELSVTPAACGYLAERGFDPQFGARPLKRTLQTLVQNPLARRLIAGEVADGSTVTVDLPAGQRRLRFEAVSAPTPR